MVFSSHVFLFYFLPLLVLLYFLSPGLRLKNFVLLVFSYVFYAWGAADVVIPLFLLSIFNYLVSLYLPPIGERIGLATEPKKAPQSESTRRGLLALGIGVNLSFLCYYKYFNFFSAEISRLLSVLGLPTLEASSILLPAGVSFFTFQKISCLVDVYQGKAKVAKSFLQYLLFAILFPPLIAGPIVRYHDIAEQIAQRRNTLDDVFYGIYRFCIGLAKKVLIADQMGMVVNNIFSLPSSSLSTEYAWLGIVCYSMQIYFDFSGYSDMALGLGRIFGFRLLENFNAPYVAQSMTEFWRRWHISLTNFMREYLYIPLGGNRVGKARVYFNLWIVFLLSGLWHGAAWNFVFWGAYHGLWLTLDRLFFLRFSSRWPMALRVLATFVLINIGWVFFRASSTRDAFSFLHVMLNPWFFDNPALPLARSEIIHNRGIVTLIIALGLSFGPLWKPFAKTLDNHLKANCGTGAICQRFALCVTCYLLSLLNMSTSKFSPFLYFNF